MIYQHVCQTLELYKLSNDISEENNLAKNEKQKLAEMAKVLSEFLRETEAQMPVIKKKNKAVPYPDEVI